jgi:hypothetical protein
MNFIDIGPYVVDLDKLLFVERGKWHVDRQDYEAVLVMVGGIRCETRVFIQEVRALIVKTDLCLDGRK